MGRAKSAALFSERQSCFGCCPAPGSPAQTSQIDPVGSMATEPGPQPELTTLPPYMPLHG